MRIGINFVAVTTGIRNCIRHKSWILICFKGWIRIRTGMFMRIRNTGFMSLILKAVEKATVPCCPVCMCL
jgi:hypothetical protein